MTDVLEQAQDWARRLPALSARIEADRKLPADIATAFAEAGFFRLLVPAEYGGLEVHPAEFVDVIKSVSRGDGSAGWNVMIGATTGLLAASLPDQFAQQIYGADLDTLTVGVTAPLGRASVVEGGYSVTGRWPFASGCQNADWICGGAFVYDGEQQRSDARGAPELHLMMFESSAVTIEDSWHVSGLKGTGSHHISVQDGFVPVGRSVVLGSRSRVQRPLYQFPMLGLLALGVSSVSLGIGYKALGAFIELAGGKKPTGSNRTLAERALVQSEVARAKADLESAEAYMKKVINDAWQLAVAGERLPIEIKADLRLAAANTTHRSVQAVDRLYQCGGGSAIYDTNDLQRCFRDVHVTTQHIMVADPLYEVVGRVVLGLDPKSML